MRFINIMKATMKSKILKLAAHVLVLSVMRVSATTRYVNVSGANPALPYTNWASAAVTIQEAVDAAVAGDQILVTNGVYQTGERVVSENETTTPNRVAVTKPVIVQSVNGASVTVIRGFRDPEATFDNDTSVRCVYLASGASLTGFTLTNGAARYSSGGGVRCESASAVVSNCVLTGNIAGGGVSGGTLYDCVLNGNSNGVDGNGGGANRATLNNCTLTRNYSVGR